MPATDGQVEAAINAVSAEIKRLRNVKGQIDELKARRSEINDDIASKQADVDQIRLNVDSLRNDLKSLLNAP